MNDNNHSSIAIDLETLSDVLKGDLLPMSKIPQARTSRKKDQVILYYKGTNEPHFDSILGISVLSLSVGDLFAWAYTELEGLTPFNDTLRIIDQRKIDTNQYEISTEVDQNYETWALLILGEMLTRMKSTKSLSAINLSWINATFSKAAALSVANGWSSSSRGWNDLIEAFESVTGVTGAKSNQILLREMIPIWNIVSSNTRSRHHDMSLRDPVGFTRYFCDLLENAKVLNSTEIKRLQNIVGVHSFDSDSVEKRLLGFDEIVHKYENAWVRKDRQIFWAIVLGLSASFVGRGPSHLHLLDATNSAPESRFMWAALIAQYSDTKRLPYTWSKAIKQIAREISGQAQLGWGNGYDIGRHELEWLCKLPQDINLDQFRGIRSSGGTILTELLPGVTFLARTINTEKPIHHKQQLQVNKSFELVEETVASLQMQLRTLQISLVDTDGQMNASRAKRPKQDLFEE